MGTNGQQRRHRWRARRHAQITVGLVLALILASCGGGNESADGAVPSQQAGTTSTPPAAPETPTTPIAQPSPTPEPSPTPKPTAAPAPTEALVPTPAAKLTATPVPQQASLETTPEFCEASRAAYQAHLVVDSLSPDASSPALQTALGQILLDIAEAMETAPNIELAEPPRIALISLSNIYEAAGEYGYDAQRFFGSAGIELRADFDIYLEVVAALEAYLQGPCDISLGPVRAAAVTQAQALQAQYPADVSTPPIDSGEGTYLVEDNFADIELEVPANWTSVESWNDGSTRGVIAAPDLDAYESSWNASGVRVTAADLNSGTVVNPDDIVRSTPARNECKLETTDVYDDGLYQGQINRYVNCGGGAAEAIVIAALNDDNSVLVLVELQMLEIDESVVRLIVGSFMA